MSDKLNRAQQNAKFRRAALKVELQLKRYWTGDIDWDTMEDEISKIRNEFGIFNTQLELQQLCDEEKAEDSKDE